MSIRLIVADDHPLIIFAVKQLFAATAGVEVVAEASNPTELNEKLRTVGCDVLITDFAMPSDRDPDGLLMLDALRMKHPSVKVIVLTMLGNAGLFASILNRGVSGLLSKRDDIRELPAAVQVVFRGGCHVGRRVKCEMALQLNNGSGRTDHRPLSPKELEVVRHFMSGMTINQIAEHLHRAPNTVSTQKRSAMVKLCLATDLELFDYALKHGMR